ncbi:MULTISPECIES: Gmad2 immunoglobulin-like domain-containing protein [Brevibacillus]|uniref:Gmad2 immunoglobulin-like domain-containing protein n=1 Tax=Brevibacillus TaxID=55080 RepID=UPI00156ACED0|nr:MULTISPECIES: Gmad2 immunoglobulin-like domain-containing protein [unclassified Brevibacillus]NRR01241.1 sporulation protein [Brevibacillus sp. RS1.1]NRS48046.1 sporulation protein [Brevibacillus sp. HB2.2]
MKKMLLLLLTIGLLQGCSSGTDSPSTPTEQQKPPVATKPETPASEPPASTQPTTPEKPPTNQTGQQETVYGNDIFRNVTVKKTAQDTFEIKGQASVFEAVLNYVVEDGHNELTQGSVQASTAAPDWGDFTHTLKVKKAEPNSTLTLILFETSMKDGSRRMELIIPLPE